MSHKILLYGLVPEVSRELRDVLITGHVVPGIEDDTCTCAIPWESVDLVFCPAEPELLAELLRATERQRPRLRVIAISRLPEVDQWLHSIEAGADDYCAAPFESTQISWVLQKQLSAKKI